MRRRAAWVLMPLVVAVTAGCGGADPAAPEAVATSFVLAAAGEDGAGACALLSPAVAEAVAEAADAPCADAVLESPPPDAPVVRAERYGHRALVVTRADTIFLSEFADGWKVIAAGCTARGDGRPYDCTISEG